MGRTVDTIYSALLVMIVPLTLLGVLASGPLLTLIRVPQEAYLSGADLLHGGAGRHHRYSGLQHEQRHHARPGG